jgi:predicted PurR-regulated permease PerM
MNEHKPERIALSTSEPVVRGATPDRPTPIPITQRTLRLLIAGIVAVVLLVGWMAPTALTILLGGLLIALFLSFPVGKLARFMPRGVAVATALFAVTAFAALVVVLVVPILVEQLTTLTGAAPQQTEEVERLSRDVLQALRDRGLLDREPEDVIQSVRAGVAGRLHGLLDAILGSLLDLLSNGVMVLFQFFGMLVVAVYLLSDSERIKASIVHMTPSAYQDDMEDLLSRIGQSLSRYLGGMFISATEQGILATLALYLLGVPYAFLLGVLMAITAFVPYIGAWLAAIPAVIIALTQSPLTAVLTAGAYVAINVFDSNVVSPRVQGQALHVPPLLTFLAVIAGNEIFGPLGGLLALPLVAVLRVLSDFLVERIQVEPSHPPMAERTASTERSRGRGTTSRRPSRAHRRRRLARAPHTEAGEAPQRASDESTPRAELAASDSV